MKKKAVPKKEPPTQEAIDEAERMAALLEKRGGGGGGAFNNTHTTRQPPYTISVPLKPLSLPVSPCWLRVEHRIMLTQSALLKGWWFSSSSFRPHTMDPTEGPRRYAPNSSGRSPSRGAGAGCTFIACCCGDKEFGLLILGGGELSWSRCCDTASTGAWSAKMEIIR